MARDSGDTITSGRSTIPIHIQNDLGVLSVLREKLFLGSVSVQRIVHWRYNIPVICSIAGLNLRGAYGRAIFLAELERKICQ